MPGILRLLLALVVGCAVLTLAPAMAAVPEWNAVRTHSVQLGPEASRLLVGFRATPGNAVVKAVRVRARAQSITLVQAGTSDADVAGLALRTGLGVARSRQITPSMHVLYLQKNAVWRRRPRAAEKTARRSRGSVCGRRSAPLPACDAG